MVRLIAYSIKIWQGLIRKVSRYGMVDCVQYQDMVVRLIAYSIKIW
jgi:hypothetical protein